MPFYEYECGCGNTFEAVKSMADRHNATCDCGKTPKLKMSSFMSRVAEYFTVMKHDGTVLHQTQTTEKLPPTGYGMEA